MCRQGGSSRIFVYIDYQYSILKRTMSMGNELFAAYQTSIPSCVQSKIYKTRAGEGCCFHNILNPIQLCIHLTQPLGFEHLNCLAPIDRMMTPGNRYVCVSHPSQSSSQTTVGFALINGRPIDET